MVTGIDIGIFLGEDSDDEDDLNIRRGSFLLVSEFGFLRISDSEYLLLDEE